MKVKIGNIIYDANQEPIMIILDGQDKRNIQNMHPDATKYCAFPDSTSLKLIKEFMKYEK
jgi:hypothetical protein